MCMPFNQNGFLSLLGAIWLGKGIGNENGLAAATPFSVVWFCCNFAARGLMHMQQTEQSLCWKNSRSSRVLFGHLEPSLYIQKL